MYANWYNSTNLDFCVCNRVSRDGQSSNSNYLATAASHAAGSVRTISVSSILHIRNESLDKRSDGTDPDSVSAEECRVASESELEYRRRAAHGKNIARIFFVFNLSLISSKRFARNYAVKYISYNNFLVRYE